MIEITLTDEEFQLLIDNTRYSIAKDSRKIIKLNEEIEKTTYRLTKDRCRKNSDLLNKLFSLKQVK